MKFIRSTFLLILLTTFAVSASGVYAHFEHPNLSPHTLEQNTQQKGYAKQDLTPEQRVEKKLDWMKKELKLDDQQAAKIKTILLEKQSKRIDKQSLQNASPEQKKAAVEKMLQERKLTHDRIISLLTPSQKIKYESLMKTKGGDARKLQNIPKNN